MIPGTGLLVDSSGPLCALLGPDQLTIERQQELAPSLPGQKILECLIGRVACLEGEQQPVVKNLGVPGASEVESTVQIRQASRVEVAGQMTQKIEKVVSCPALGIQ